MAADNGGRDFNIFLRGTQSVAISKHNPRDVHAEITSKIEYSMKIDNVRFAQTASVIFSTKCVLCAINICKVSSFVGVQVSSRIIWKIFPID